MGDSIYKYYCSKSGKRISRQPLGLCESCKNLVYVDCPKYDPKIINMSEEMRKWFSSHKGGESQQ